MIFSLVISQERPQNERRLAAEILALKNEARLPFACHKNATIRTPGRPMSRSRRHKTGHGRTHHRECDLHRHLPVDNERRLSHPQL